MPGSGHAQNLMAHRLEKSFVYRLVHRLFHRHLTDTGKLLFWIFLASTSVSLFSFYLKAYIVWSGLIGLFATSVVFARLARRKLNLRVLAPERVRHHQPFRIEIETRNASRLPAWDLRLYYRLAPELALLEPTLVLADLNPNEMFRFSATVLAKKRGAYTLSELFQETCYPFGLWNDVKTHFLEHRFLVYPKYSPLRTFDIPVGRKYQPGGLALTSFLGDSTEFLSTRDFRLGDPLRHIHWRSWARLGKPIVKEYGEEYFCRLALIVDTVVPEKSLDHALEQSISLAAAITDYLSREEYVIDIFAAGPKLYRMQAGRSLAYLENIMDILACLEPTPPNDVSFQEMELALQEELDGISTCILLFTDWNEQRAQLLQTLQYQGTAVQGFFISDDAQLASSLPTEVRWLTPSVIEAGIDEL